MLNITIWIKSLRPYLDPIKTSRKQCNCLYGLYVESLR
nr:MAG TPA: hypothetical protein [Caudoviricetes sp.]